jgi:YggT family protein
MNAPTELLNLALFLSFALGIYNLLIWIRIMITWVQIPLQKQGPRQESGLERFLKKVVDPYLNLFKGIGWLRTKKMDFSPLLAFALLSVLQSLLSIFGTTGSLSLGITLALIVQTFYAYIISPLFFILIILLIVRLFFCFKRTPTTIVMARGIESIIGGLLNYVQKLFFGSRGVANRTLIIASLVLTIILYILLRFGFIYIASTLAHL